eukprot:1450_1
MNMDVIEVKSSSLKDKSVDASNFIGIQRGIKYCITNTDKNAYFSVKLKGKEFTPTKYVLQNYSNGDRWCIGGWNLEGSNDNGKTWIIIHEQRNFDYDHAGGNCKGGTVACDIEKQKIPNNRFSEFRIVLKQPLVDGGVDSDDEDQQYLRNINDGGWQLACSGFELYGFLYAGEEEKINE